MHQKQNTMNTTITTPSTPSSTKLSVTLGDLESAIEAAFEYGKTYTMEVLAYMGDDLVPSRLYKKIDAAVRKLEAEACKAQATADALSAQVKAYKDVGGGPWSE